MTGSEIFEKYTKNCTPADTPIKKYGQDLRTMYFNVNSHGQKDEFFNLLEKAEKESKMLAIDMPNDIMWDDFDISSIVLV